ncbi:MAG: hypothetical protein R6U95_02590 [Bacteroidales bacterium]
MNIIKFNIHKLTSKLSKKICPHVSIYIISNDQIFLSSFSKKLKLHIPHNIYYFKNGEIFLEETFIQKSDPYKIHVIISDYFIKNNEDNFFPLNGLDIYEIILHTFPETTFILLGSKNDFLIGDTIPEPVIAVEKNSHTYIRVKNILLSLYNKQNITSQKKINIVLFSILGSIICTLCILIFTTLLI